MLSQKERFRFLWLNSIPLRYSMHHIFSINLSIDGHLGYFHILAIENSAAMYMGVYIYLFKLVFSFSSDKFPEVECWSLHFQFSEEPPCCFSFWLHQFTFLPMVHKSSLFPHSHQNLLFLIILVTAFLIDVR